MFDVCATGDTAHIDTIFKFLPHASTWEHRYSSLLQWSVRLGQQGHVAMVGRTAYFGLLVINVCNHAEHYEMPCTFTRNKITIWQELWSVLKKKPFQNIYCLFITELSSILQDRLGAEVLFLSRMSYVGFYHDIARRQVANVGHGLKRWRAASSVLIKQWQTTKKRWSSSAGFSRWLRNPHRKNLTWFEMDETASATWFGCWYCVMRRLAMCTSH
jgi:hypothetical protein